MKTNRRGLAMLLLGIALTASACTFSLAEDITPPEGSELSAEESSRTEFEFPSGVIDPENGAAIYTQSCAPCHGSGGLGDGPQAGELPFPPAPIGERAYARELSFEDWFLQISNGNIDRFMPPFAGSYSVQERWDVLAYAITLGIPDDAAISEESLGLIPTVYRSLNAIAPLAGGELFDIVSENVDANESEFSDEDIWELVDGLQLLALGVEAQAAEVASSEEESSVADLPERIDIRGVVSNASSGAIPDGLEVILHVAVDGGEADTITAPISVNGNFSFDGYEIQENDLYFFSVDFQSLSYFSAFFSAEMLADSDEIDIEIFESSKATDHLDIELINLVFEFPEVGVVQVIEQVLISNDGNVAAAPGDGGEALIRYELPEGASNLIFEQGILGDRFIANESGFGDIRAVLPGNNSYQLLFGYRLPYFGDLTIEIPLQFSANSLAVFLPLGNIEIDENNFNYAGQQQVQSEIFESYIYSETLEQGERVTIDLRGSHPLERSAVQRLIKDNDFLVGLVALLLSVGIGWWWYRSVDEQHAKPGLKKSKNTLLNEIVDLDQKFDSGQLSKRKHAKMRQMKMDELRQKVGKQSK